MKIAFFEIEDWESDYFKNQLRGFDASFFQESLSPTNTALAKDCEIVSVFTGSSVFDKEMFNKFTNLKLIATRSTGFDHIDIDEARKRNVVVCNVPLYGENTVAEHTFALILGLSRKIYQSIERTKKGSFTFHGLRGFDLNQKTLGIVGTGHIGQHVARIAQGFQMNVLAFDINEDKKLAKKLDFKYVSLEELLKNSDIITLHVPHNKNTHHLINSGNINLIKKGAYIINTARGGVIETSALVDALGRGIIAGVGLDVLEEECYIKEESQLLSREFPEKCDLKILLQNHVLMKQENVIITPHNAFNSKEALERILETTILNIKSFLKNRPQNIVGDRAL